MSAGLEAYKVSALYWGRLFRAIATASRNRVDTGIRLEPRRPRSRRDILRLLGFDTEDEEDREL